MESIRVEKRILACRLHHKVDGKLFQHSLRRTDVIKQTKSHWAKIGTIGKALLLEGGCQKDVMVVSPVVRDRLSA